MKFIGCSTHLFVHELLRTEHLSMVRRAGFSSVELWAARPHWDYGDPGRVFDVASACAHLGLAIASIHGPFYLHVDDAKAGRWLTLYHEDASVRAQALSELKTVVWTAAEIGAPVVVVHWEAAGFGWEELEALVETAGEAGVQVALENSHDRPEASVSTILATLEKLGADATVGLCFDTGHANVAEADMGEALRAAAPRLLTFHVHDNDGASDSHMVPYQGSIEWPALAQTVRDLHLENRPFTLELRRYGSYMDELTSARRSVERMFGGLR